MTKFLMLEAVRSCPRLLVHGIGDFPLATNIPWQEQELGQMFGACEFSSAGECLPAGQRDRLWGASGVLCPVSQWLGEH